MGSEYNAKIKLQDHIKQQKSVLDQLQSAYKELRNWKNLGNRNIERDIDDMNNDRKTLIDEFVRIRNQCKSLGDVFKLLDGN